MLKEIQSVKKFNDLRGLTAKGFNPVRENTFLLSEELETLDHEDMAYDLLGVLQLPSDFSHDHFAKHLTEGYGLTHSHTEHMVEYVDKVIDHWVFGIGGMIKMGMTPEQALECFQYVLEANELKPIGKVNNDGKQEKGNDFELVDPKHKIRKLIESL